MGKRRKRISAQHCDIALLALTTSSSSHSGKQAGRQIRTHIQTNSEKEEEEEGRTHKKHRNTTD